MNNTACPTAPSLGTLLDPVTLLPEPPLEAFAPPTLTHCHASDGLWSPEHPDPKKTTTFSCIITDSAPRLLAAVEGREEPIYTINARCQAKFRLCPECHRVAENIVANRGFLVEGRNWEEMAHFMHREVSALRSNERVNNV